MRAIVHLLAATAMLCGPVGMVPLQASQQSANPNDDDVGSIGAVLDATVYRHGASMAGFKVLDARGSPYSGLEPGDIVIAVDDIYFTARDTIRTLDNVVEQFYSGAPVKIVYLDASAGYRVTSQTARLAMRAPRPVYAAAPPVRVQPRPAAPAPRPAQPSPDWRRIDAVLNDLIVEDSREWWTNQYRAGSVRNSRLKWIDASSYQLSADFSYVGGAQGWVRAKFVNGEFSCIEFQDTVLGCRALREPGQRVAIAALVTLAAVAAVAVSSSSDSSDGRGASAAPDDNRTSPPQSTSYPDDGGASASAERDRKEREEREAQERRDRLRTPRVGGEDGIHGCAKEPCWDRDPN